jgi:hypothetical protein
MVCARQTLFGSSSQKSPAGDRSRSDPPAEPAGGD